METDGQQEGSLQKSHVPNQGRTNRMLTHLHSHGWRHTNR